MTFYQLQPWSKSIGPYRYHHRGEGHSRALVAALSAADSQQHGWRGNLIPSLPCCCCSSHFSESEAKAWKCVCYWCTVWWGIISNQNNTYVILVHRWMGGGGPTLISARGFIFKINIAILYRWMYSYNMGERPLREGDGIKSKPARSSFADRRKIPKYGPSRRRTESSSVKINNKLTEKYLI